MTADATARGSRLLHGVAAIAGALVAAGIAAAITSLPRAAPGLAAAAEAGLPASGTDHPVTAALLDYRAYDTLLELAVLMLSAVAILALSRGRPERPAPGSEVLTILLRLQVPVMVLIAGYLLWVGGSAPGGAFQAGAVLAAAGVLLVLGGVPLPASGDSLSLRLGLVAGLATFIAVGVACFVHGGAFLDYPTPLAAGLLSLLEVAATLSVGLTLLGMFVSIMNAGGQDAAAAGDEP